MGKTSKYMLPLKKVYIQSLSELINFSRNIFFKLYTFPGTNINQLHQTDGKVQESLTIGVYVVNNKLIKKKDDYIIFDNVCKW
jgi:hypothetical protein